MNRFNKIFELHKTASKVGKKRASGINWSIAESALKSSESPDFQLSREQIQQEIADNPIFSEADLGVIFNLKIEDHHAKMLNKQETAFIEIGAFLAGKTDQISEIGDYLLREGAAPGYVSKKFNIQFESLDLLKEKFVELNDAQIEWHRAAATAQAAEVQAKGKFGNGYMTNEVIAEYKGGWKVVYVPAADEGPNYKGDSEKSNDRTIEGNLNGLCLGSTQGLYQDNAHGKIYSVRDSSNKPHVTIRIEDNRLLEAKGKSNLPPSIDGAKVSDMWFKSQEGLEYEINGDYKAFPPWSRDKAVKKLRYNPNQFYLNGWVTSWYNQGLEELDKDVLARIAEKDIHIVYSGLGKKYKELVAPVIEYWADQYTFGDSFAIFGGLRNTTYRPSHESWTTYRKEPWMQAAVDKLMKKDSYFGFQIGIHRIEEYDAYARPAAKNFADKDPYGFFALNVQDTYPELGRLPVENIANNDPYNFFDLNLQEKYPELGKIAAKSLIKETPGQFFSLNLQKIYPDLKLLAANSLAEQYPSYFFIRNLQETYPKLGELAAKTLAKKDPHDFFYLELEEIYPEFAPRLNPLFNQRIANLQAWLLSNGFKKEEKQISKIIIGGKE